MGMVVDASLGLAQVLKKGGAMLKPGGQLQQFVDSSVLNGVEPYVPMRSGSTTRSPILSGGGVGIRPGQIGSGTLIWRGPHVRYIWYGKLMVDPATKKGAFYSPTYGFWSRPGVAKELTARDLIFDQSRHPHAGPKWGLRYKADHLTELARAVQERTAKMWKNS